MHNFSKKLRGDVAQERRTIMENCSLGSTDCPENNNRDLALGGHSTFILVLCTPERPNRTRRYTGLVWHGCAAVEF